MTVTGAGLTLGAVFFMTVFAKSKKYRELGNLALLPAFFNINESIIFSTPIVMNPMMAVPLFSHRSFRIDYLFRFIFWIRSFIYSSPSPLDNTADPLGFLSRRSACSDFTRYRVVN